MKIALRGFSLLILLMSLWLVASQSVRAQYRCGTDEVFDQKRSTDPSFQLHHDQFDQVIYDNVVSKHGIGNQLSILTGGPYTIAVVVHVVHAAGVPVGAGSNISDAQITDGIDHLNQAFDNTGHYDSLTGESIGINFCLAKQDEFGVFSSGINRIVSPLTDMYSPTDDLTLKALSTWDQTKYLNIWVVNEITSVTSGPGVAGYAYFPSSHGNPEDGIVIEARWFGDSEDDSKVLVHELGHYLGLYHTFNNGCTNDDCLVDGDKVCDTPPDASTAPIACNATANTCTTDEDDTSSNNPFRAIALGGLGEQNDMFINYMDYSDLPCMSAFTFGQKDRMITALTGARASLLNTDGCLDPCTSAITADFLASQTNIFMGGSVTFFNSSTGATSYDWQVNGSSVSSGTDLTHTFPTPGIYTVTLVASNGQPACEEYLSETITVHCHAQSSFTPDTTKTYVGGTVQFTNTSTGSVSHEWFVDGVSAGSSQDLSYQFNTAGFYSVTLIVTNGQCADTADSQIIRVGTCDNRRWNNWYFGDSAGVNFNTPTPSPLGGSGMYAYEGCASISDLEGNLLFYSNGGQTLPNTQAAGVWNRNHEQMPNGVFDTTGGCQSATQGTIIVPDPGNPDHYYIFTVNCHEHDGYNFNSTRLQFHTVDMTLDGGLGDVVIRDSLLDVGFNENVLAAKHCNGKDYWIIVAKRTQQTYYSYLVDSSGVHPPVLSVIPSAIFPYAPVISTDGTKIVSFGSEDFNILDFNTTTGELSNYQFIDIGGGGYVSGIALSPNGRFVYINRETTTIIRTMFQFDLEATDIAASVQTIATSPFLGPRRMRLAPDGKIYCARPNYHYLAVIHSPNAEGVACNFELDGFDLTASGGVSLHELPGMIGNELFPSPVKIVGPTEVCANSGIESFFESNSTCPLIGLDWQIRGTSTISTIDNDTVRLNIGQAGTDTLILVHEDDCGVQTDTMLILINPRPTTLDLGPDTAICSGVSITFQAGPGYSTYAWHNTSNATSFTATSPGTYWVQVSNSFGCTMRDSVEVLSNNPPPPVINLGADTSVCEGIVHVLDAGSDDLDFTWHDASTDRYFTVWLPGTYWVDAIDECGQTATDSIVINYLPTQSIFPSDTVFCDGSNLLLDAGAGHTSYMWQDGSMGQTYNISSPGQYWVEVTNQCSILMRDTITAAYAPDPVFMLGNDTTICNSDTLMLNAPANYASYLWNDGSIWPFLAVNDDGSYWVNLVNHIGCEWRDTIEISTHPDLYQDPLGQDSTICDGDTVVLDPGLGYTMVEWNGGSQNQTFSAVTSGLYSVELTDGNNCTQYDSVTITVLSLPVLDLGGDTLICDEDTVTLQGPPGNATYLWNGQFPGSQLAISDSGMYVLEITDGDGCYNIDSLQVGIQDVASEVMGPDTVCQGDSCGSVYELTGFTNTVSNSWNVSLGSVCAGAGGQLIQVDWQSGPGNVNYSGVSDIGCEVSAVLPVYVHLLAVDPLGPDTAICDDDSILLDPGPGFALHQWSDGSLAATLEAGAGGQYWVEMTDLNNCLLRDTLDIGNLPLPVVDLGGDTLICDGDTILLQGAPGNADYLWNGQFVGPQLAVSDSGLYWLEVTDSSGCHNEDSIEVDILSPQAQIQGPDTVCQTGDCNSVFELTGFTNTVSHTWSANFGFICSGASGYIIDVEWSFQGNNSVIFSGLTAEGCEVYAEHPLYVRATSNTTVIASGDSLYSSLTGVAYQWYSGQSAIAGATEHYFVPTSSGDYSVEVTDANGCVIRSDPYSFIVGIAELPGLNGLHVYPNPFSDEIRLELNIGSGMETEIGLVDMLGREIIQKKAQFYPPGVHSIVLTMESFNLATGPYLLKVSLNGRERVFRLIKR